jgi:ATP-dependent RNA helicase DeaD
MMQSRNQREDRPRREYGDRPRRDYGDRPGRDYGDRPGRSRDSNAEPGAPSEAMTAGGGEE